MLQLLHPLVVLMLSHLPHLSGHHRPLYSPSMVTHWTALRGGRGRGGCNTHVQCQRPGVTCLDWKHSRNMHTYIYTHIHAHMHKCTHTHLMVQVYIVYCTIDVAHVLDMQQGPLPPFSVAHGNSHVDPMTSRDGSVDCFITIH